MVAEPAWIAELRTNGFAIIKGAVPKDRADKYADQFLEWAEKFPLGFKRDDVSTWDANHLPIHYVGGLYVGYSVAHEKFVWESRMEEGVIKPFEQLWGTDKLICSYDAINISLPQGPNGRKDIEPTARWPHQDQTPLKEEFELAQGLIALTKSGPQDGGLIVMKGSNNLQKQFFAETGGIKAEQDSGDRNYYIYTEDDMKWFYEHGCEEIKVESEAGDLILWDSRTIHWNCAPKAEQIRCVTYVCMAPVSYATPEVLAKKKEAFEKHLATTHWPHLAIIPYEEYGPVQRDGVVDPYDRSEPFEKPELSDKLLRLAGLKPYDA